MNETQITRRDFLKLTRRFLLLASGILGFGGLLRFFSYQTQPSSPTEFNLGPASAFPMDSHTLLAEVPAMLERNETGFTAYSLVCTHLGCTVDPQQNGFACPCHGSRFDSKGQVTHGPAGKALAQLRTEIDSDGILHLFTGKI